MAEKKVEKVKKVKAKKKKPEPKVVEKRFIISLKSVFNAPKPKRANRAINAIKRFLKKHFRVKEENIFISEAVNRFVWKFGRENIPRKIDVKVVEKDKKVRVYLQEEKVVEKKPEKKKEEKKELTKEEKEKIEEIERKKKEKKEMEKAAEAAAIKRGTQKG